MRIKTQFIITMLLFCMILVVIAASAVITNQKIQRASLQENLAASIAQGANELGYLSNDYLIYRENQQLRRWQSRFASFSSQVASLNVDKPEQQALVHNIKANEQRWKQVFESVASAVGSSSPNRSTTLDMAFLQVSWSRMAVQSQGLASDASRLSRLLDQQVDQLVEIRTMLMYVMVGLFGVFLLASYRLTYGRILKSILTLRAGTMIIGSGNLDFKIEEKKNDEIGDLSHAFNRMTTDLKAVTASKTDLEREIVERKKAEEDLREALERAVWLARFPDENPNPVVRVSLEGKILYCNPASIELPEWECKVDRPLHHRLMSLVGKAMAEGKEIQEDIQLNGRFYVVWVVPFPGEGYANVYGRDITARKQAEDALRESEDRLRFALETSHTGAWDLDLVDHTAFRSLEHDRIFGYAELLPQWTYEMFLEHVLPEDREMVNDKFQRAVNTQSDWNFECRIRRSDGQVRWIWAAGRHRSDASHLLRRMAGIVQDITERKQAEEVLRQRTLELKRLTETLEQEVQLRTEELEVANEELKVEIDQCQKVEIELKKSESDLRQLSVELLNAQEKERKLVAGEIHDSLGSSLSAIKFKVETALAKVANKNPETATVLQSIIPIVQGAIDEARRIQMNLRPSILDDLGILATIKWFCRQFESTYSSIRIRQAINIDEQEVPDSLKTVIFRVLQEALNNVAKHGKANVVLLSFWKTDQSVKLMIRNNGPGFDPSKLQSPTGTATGLGLKNMRERVELSGGSLVIESTERQGTTIRASWPIGMRNGGQN